MNMKRFSIMMAALALMMPAHAQFFDRLINSARTTAEQSVEQQVNRKVEQGIDKAFNPEFQKQEQQEQAEPQQPQEQPQSGWTCPACGHKGNTGKFCTECGAKKPEAGNAAPAPKKSVESVYAKSDFVPGDEIMFEDDLVGEQMGEFPSKWDLLEGNAEIAAVNGQTVINLTDASTEIMPLMKDPKNYLTEAFTLEFDFLGGSDEKQIFTAYSPQEYRG